jgi:tetratricopeptide (TPR) repeat protein
MSLLETQNFTSTSARQKHFLVPYIENKTFVGRDSLLFQLSSRLREDKQYQYNHRVALHGLGGVGKTQTALAYVYANRAHYDSIFWVTGASEASLLSDFQRIATETKCAANDTTDAVQILRKVHEWLDAQTSWLLIIDNLDDIAGWINKFLPTNDSKKHTLITTRNPNSQGIPAKGLEVSVLDPADAVILLSALAEITLNESSSETKQANQIVDDLGYLPLAIEQAAAYVREVAGNFTTFIGDYTKCRGDIHHWIPQGNRTYSHSVATTWSMSVKVVRNNNPHAAKLLQLISFLNPDGVLIEFLQSAAETLPEGLREVLSNRIDLSKAVIELEKFSLLKWNRITKTLVIHRLVQMVVQDEMSKADLTRFRSTIIDMCDHSFPQEWTNETRLLCRVLISQIMRPLLDHQVICSAKSARVMNYVGCFLRDDGKYNDSEKLLCKARKIMADILGHDHPDTLTTMNNLASTYRTQGKYDEAAKLQEQVLYKVQHILGHDHPNTLTTMNNLASTYRDQGKYDEAAKLEEQVLSKRQHILGHDHPDTLMSMENLIE